HARPSPALVEARHHEAAGTLFRHRRGALPPALDHDPLPAQAADIGPEMLRGPVSSVSGFSLGPDARRWLNRIGSLLGAAGVVFVALRLASYADEIDAAGIGVGGYVALLGLAVVYGASNLLLALGWWR